MVTQTSETTAQSNSTVTVSAAAWNDLLVHARRRQTLRVLVDRDTPLELTALADAVAERSDEVVDPTEVAVSLHHVHLPKLAAHGVVEYDTESNRVTAFPAAGVVRDRL